MKICVHLLKIVHLNENQFNKIFNIGEVQNCTQCLARINFIYKIVLLVVTDKSVKISFLRQKLLGYDIYDFFEFETIQITKNRFHVFRAIKNCKFY